LDQQSLTDFFHRQDREVANATPFCLGDEKLILLVHGQTDELELRQFEHHLAECSYCHARLAVLAQVQQKNEPEQVSDDLLNNAIELGNRGRSWRLRRSHAWAVAAALVLTFSILTVTNLDQHPGPITSGPDSEETRQFRSLDPVALVPRITLPVKDSRIRNGELVIRWMEVPGSMHYEVRVVDAAGFIIWSDRVDGTEIRPPTASLIQPGQPYFVRVDAFMAGANSVSSEHIKFTVIGSEP